MYAWFKLGKPWKVWTKTSPAASVMLPEKRLWYNYCQYPVPFINLRIYKKIGKISLFLLATADNMNDEMACWTHLPVDKLEGSPVFYTARQRRCNNQEAKSDVVVSSGRFPISKTCGYCLLVNTVNSCAIIFFCQTCYLMCLPKIRPTDKKCGHQTFNHLVVLAIAFLHILKPSLKSSHLMGGDRNEQKIFTP